MSHVSPTHAAYCASGEAWPNRGWVKNVNTSQTLYVNFWGQAGSGCNGTNQPVSAGQDSGQYTDDTDEYTYGGSTWTESHGFVDYYVSGIVDLGGGRAISAVWCNADSSVPTTLKIRCDW